MSARRAFDLERVPVPTWLHDIDDVDAVERFGEQKEWGFAIPWTYGALADPGGGLPMLRAPQRGDDFWPGALAYWSSLLHLLVYAFGWSRPDRGLRWWYDAGKPTNDLGLALLSEVWDADGQLDWFAAWLWTTGSRSYLPRPIGVVDEASVVVAPDWLEQVDRTIQESGTPAPYGGGYDPLHLTGHINGPMHRSKSGEATFTPAAESGPSTLALPSMEGWYSELVDLEPGRPDLTSEGVQVVVGQVGPLGVFRRSPATGLWSSTDEVLHLAGNA